MQTGHERSRTVRTRYGKLTERDHRQCDSYDDGKKRLGLRTSGWTTRKLLDTQEVVGKSLGSSEEELKLLSRVVICGSEDKFFQNT